MQSSHLQSGPDSLLDVGTSIKVKVDAPKQTSGQEVLPGAFKEVRGCLFVFFAFFFLFVAWHHCVSRWPDDALLQEEALKGGENGTKEDDQAVKDEAWQDTPGTLFEGEAEGGSSANSQSAGGGAESGGSNSIGGTTLSATESLHSGNRAPVLNAQKSTYQMWVCKCGVNNYLDRPVCYRCQSARTTENRMYEAVSSCCLLSHDNLPSVETWACQAKKKNGRPCTYPNIVGDRSCQSCGAIAGSTYCRTADSISTDLSRTHMLAVGFSHHWSHDDLVKCEQRKRNAVGFSFSQRNTPFENSFHEQTSFAEARVDPYAVQPQWAQQGSSTCEEEHSHVSSISHSFFSA